MSRLFYSSLCFAYALFIAGVCSQVTFVTPPPEGPLHVYDDNPTYIYGANYTVRWTVGKHIPQGVTSLDLRVFTDYVTMGPPDDHGILISSNISLSLTEIWIIIDKDMVDSSDDGSTPLYLSMNEAGGYSSLGMSHYFNIAGEIVPPMVTTTSSTTTASSTTSTETTMGTTTSGETTTITTTLVETTTIITTLGETTASSTTSTETTRGTTTSVGTTRSTTTSIGTTISTTASTETAVSTTMSTTSAASTSAIPNRASPHSTLITSVIPSTTALNPDPKPNNGHLSKKAVIGISVGVTIGGILLLGGLAFFAWRHKIPSGVFASGSKSTTLSRSDMAELPAEHWVNVAGIQTHPGGPYELSS